jgi:corrinoid protein of di/trimethylamine methyltransferase
MSQELLKKIITSLVDGEPDQTVELVQQAIAQKMEPLVIIEEGLVPGMGIVGEKYEEGEYFLPNLVVSASGMKRSMELLDPILYDRHEGIKTMGKVVIGTVHGDIHEIGKSLVATMLAVNGFQVYDLGVDVPVQTMLKKVRETGATLVGLSALLTTTMIVQRELIDALKAEGLRDKVKVMVGGAPVTKSWSDEIGADGYAEDAIRAVEVARYLCS